jgi:hypothetical protein
MHPLAQQNIPNQSVNVPESYDIETPISQSSSVNVTLRQKVSYCFRYIFCCKDDNWLRGAPIFEDQLTAFNSTVATRYQSFDLHSSEDAPSRSARTIQGDFDDVKYQHLDLKQLEEGLTTIADLDETEEKMENKEEPKNNRSYCTSLFSIFSCCLPKSCFSVGFDIKD